MKHENVKCVNEKCNSHSPGKFGDNCRYYKNIRDCEDLVELKTIQWLTVRWIDVNEILPEINKYVLWRYESGGVIFDCINDETNVPKFLEGGEISRIITGPIIAWMPVPGEE